VKRAIEGTLGKEMLGRFLQPSVVERAFKDPVALLAKPKAVDATVLVSDLRGFTALAEQMKPSAVLAVLSEIQTALAEAVRKHGGTVDKFMGDGMLAVFGAPDPLIDHARRAVATALDIRRAMDALNAAHPDRLPLRVGMGIHSGNLIAGVLGSGDRMEFTIIGDTVNTASRLEGMTKDFGVDVLLSAATAKQLVDVAIEELGSAPVRGKAEQIALYTLLPRMDGRSGEKVRIGS
jgi:adenylate cyclase